MAFTATTNCSNLKIQKKNSKIFKYFDRRIAATAMRLYNGVEEKPLASR